MSDHPNKPRWEVSAKIILLVAAVLLVGGVSSRVAFLILCTDVHTKATYGGITFYGDGSVLDWVNASPDKMVPGSELFLQFSGHQPISIQDITEEYIQKNYSIAESKYRNQYYGDPFFSRHSDKNSMKYWGFGVQFEFEKGRLIQVNLQRCDETGVSCSNRKEGTYIQVPISEEDLTKAWGKPDQFERKRVKSFRAAE